MTLRALPCPRANQSPPGSRILLYQPQVSEWSGQRHMVAYAGVSVEASGATKLALGSVKIEANTTVAFDERLVRFSDWALTESNFPTLSKDQTRGRGAARARARRGR